MKILNKATRPGSSCCRNKVSATVFQPRVFTPERRLNALWRELLFHGLISRSGFPCGARARLIDSIRTQFCPLADDVKFVPGHGPESTFGDERRGNPFVADALFG